MPSSAGISGAAAACGSPPTAGVGCSRPASSTTLTGRASCARIGVARCWMLATLTTAGSSGAVTQTACGRSVRAIRRATIACSSRSLAEPSSCSPRWSSTAGSAERRIEPASATRRRAQPLAPHQQLRRGGHERAVAAAGAEHEAGAEGGAQDPERRGRVVRRGRVDRDLAGEHDLLERARADALDGAGDGLLVVLGRRDARDPEAARRARDRAAAAAARAARRRAPRCGPRAPRARRRARRARRA